jgi:SAM-dependent methyltransferase
MRPEHKFWDDIATNHLNKAYIVKPIGEYKADETRDLVSSWIGETEGLRVLKTDLFEEALGPDQFLFYMFKKDHIFGTDISQVVARHAKAHSDRLGRALFCCVGGVRQLPYKNESFDIIISNSTLDHFSKKQLPIAISGLKRVLKKNGKIILTINNRHNKIFYFVLRPGRMFRAIPYHV